jgi:divalent metal cation (Fe/Co/Zn/Cd) transporter
VTAFIVHVGWEVTSEVVGRLMDGVDPKLLSRAERAALTVAGMHHVHVRARWSGRSLIFEIEAFIEPNSTLEHAESLGRDIERAVIDEIPETRVVLWSPHALPSSGMG